jgi:hypothetical protein
VAIAVNSTKETLATAYAGVALYASLHTADPGSTGTSEATGGSPAYARKLVTWTGGASDGVTVGSQVTFDVPAGTYTHFGLWSAVTGGTFRDKGTITSTVMGGQGQILVTPTYTQS